MATQVRLDPNTREFVTGPQSQTTENVTPQDTLNRPSGVTRLEVRGGEVTQTHEGVVKVQHRPPTGGELGSVLATVRSPNKSTHTGPVRGTDLVTYDGMTMTVDLAARSGLITKNPDGTYGEASPTPQPQRQVEQRPSQTATMYQYLSQALQSADAAAHVLNALAGQVSEVQVEGISRRLGVTTEESYKLLEGVQGELIKQASRVGQQYGLSTEDLEAMWADALDRDEGRALDALRQLAYRGSSTELTTLMRNYMHRHSNVVAELVES
jgi:hypothetical protein